MSEPIERPGLIIFLNGVSSSGKSSIAEHLLDVLDTPYFHMSVDAINGMRAKRQSRELGPGELHQVLHRTRAGFHRAVAGMAHAGNDLVVDYILSEPWRLQDCLEVLAGLDVVFVGVHCPAAELNRRERARGDREIGQGEAQLGRVHAHSLYDLECDTSVQTPRQCAERISAFLPHRPRPDAFDRLRQLGFGSAG